MAIGHEIRSDALLLGGLFNQKQKLVSRLNARCLFAVFLIFFVPLVVIAQSAALESFPSFKSRLWQVSDDAARNTVRSVAQTPDGFLWIGTQGGLARFDGEKFEFV